MIASIYTSVFNAYRRNKQLIHVTTWVGFQEIILNEEKTNNPNLKGLPAYELIFFFFYILKLTEI